MAIIKNGKIHGKVGNFVYRVVDGQEIIQAYPRKTKPKGGTLVENKSFKKAAKLSSGIYQLVKDFALNEITGHLYNEMMKFFKTNFFSKRAITDDPKFDQWNKVNGFERLAINSNVKVDDILIRNPKLDINGNICSISFPKFDSFPRLSRFGGSRNIIKDASYISFGFTLIHYDFSSGLTEVVSNFESERFILPEGFDEQHIEIPLVVNEIPIEKGLLVFAFGLRFFTSQQSFGYLNTKRFNPSTILGVWYKR